MKILKNSGEELLSLAFSVDADNNLCAHVGAKEYGVELDMPKSVVSFENTKEGLLVHGGLSGVEDGTVDILVEYADVKALREIPGKGLVGFALKAFR